MKTLRIDEKWSVEFDPDNYDRSVRVKRYDAGFWPWGGNGEGNFAFAMVHALLSERESVERWKANMRDMHSALEAMRNAINEHVPMPSIESDLLEGPEPAVFAEKVATAVCVEIERLRAKLAEAEGKPRDNEEADQRLMEFLVQTIGGHSVTIVREGKRLIGWCAGGKGRSIAMADLRAAFPSKGEGE